MPFWLHEGTLKRFDAEVHSVINEYLFGLENAARTCEWTNSGREFHNPWFKPIRFFIADQEGNKKTIPIKNDSDSWLHIEAEIQEMDRALTIGYAIYSENGNLLYWSYQTDGSERNWPELHKGLCALRGRIPGRLLNEGVYTIELIGGLTF